MTEAELKVLEDLTRILDGPAPTKEQCENASARLKKILQHNRPKPADDPVPPVAGGG